MDLKLICTDVPDEFIFDNTEFEVSEINESHSNLLLFRKILNTAGHYATLELNKWRLDGSYNFINDNKIPYWSVQTSNDTAINERYYFTSPITITCKFETVHTFKGLSVITDDECYSNYVNVKWYSDNTLKVNRNYNPDSNMYFCDASGLESINKIVIKFYSMNKPNRYLKLYGLVHGGTNIFTGDNIVNADIVEEISLQCTQLPAFSAEMTLKSEKGNVFKSLSPFQLLRNNISRGIFYIGESEQVNENVYRITGYNFVSLLDRYKLNKYVKSNATFENVLLENILNDFYVTYSAENNVLNTEVDTMFVLPENTARNGLLQLISATGILYTMTRDNEIIFTNELQSKEYIIHETNIFDDANITEPFEKCNIVLNRTVYIPTADVGEEHNMITQKITEIPESYDPSYIGSVFFIEFIEGTPAYPPSISLVTYAGTELKGVEFVSKSPYGCYIRITGEYNYKAAYIRYRNATTGSKQTALIINTPKYGRLTIAEKVINNIYFSDECDRLQEERTKKYYKNDKTFESTIIMPESLQCGDRVQFASDKYNNFTGIVEQIEYSLNGGQKLIGKVKVHAYG